MIYKNKISNLKYRNLMLNCLLIGTGKSATRGEQQEEGRGGCSAVTGCARE